MIETLPNAVVGVGVGAIVGSFITTWAVRTARGEQALTGRSRCDGCGKALSFAATLPLASFAVLKGRCQSCRAKIDAAHPFGEAAGAVIGAFAATRSSPLEATLIVGMGVVVLAASVIDAKTLRLPNALTLATAILAGALATSRHQEVEGVVAALVVAVALAVLRVTIRSEGAPGLGLGDVKLAAALALWLGAASSWMLVLACALGLAEIGRAHV